MNSIRHAFSALAGSLCVVALLSVAVASAGEAAPASRSRLVRNLEAGKPQRVVIFGTSLSKGGAWVTQLQAALEARFPGLVTFVNGAKGGQNSRWGLANVDQNVVAAKPDTVFVEFAINDSVARFDLSQAESRKNLEAILGRIRQALPDCEIVLQIMNPAFGKQPGEPSYRRDQDAYQQIYRDVGRAQGLLVIDHSIEWKALAAKEGEATVLKYINDGVHPNVEGYRRFVTPTLLRALGLPEKTPVQP